MGTSFSHFAHPGHRFKRLQAKDLDGNVLCQMCREAIRNGAAAAHYYRCQQCGGSFSFHEACFQRPERIDSHWAHLMQPSHPLTLSAADHRTQGRSCSICGRAFSGAFVYGCAGGRRDCHGFVAHPSCLDLPRTLTTGLHRHQLMLMSPPRDWRRGICLDTSCPNRNNVPAAAWSYQCHECKVHVCLSDGEESTTTASPGHFRCCVGCTGTASPGGHYRCGAKEGVKALGCLGTALGTCGNRFARACVGLESS